MIKINLIFAITSFLCEALGDNVQLDREIPDSSPFETVFSAVNVDADDLEHLPSIGNGHVATVVYSNTVHMSGLYNGKDGNSHRARIPSGNNIRIHFPSGKNDKTSFIQVNSHNLSLDVSKAVFLESWNLSEDDHGRGQSEIRVEQRTFAHRYFTKLIVTQIQVTSKNLQDAVILHISSTGNDSSADLKTPTSGKFIQSPLEGTSFTCAEIYEKEDDDKQDAAFIIPRVCTISSPVPSTIVIPSNVTKTTMTFITGYGSSLEEIQPDFQAAAEMIVAGKHGKIRQLHVDTWQKIFGNGGGGDIGGGSAIHVEGNPQLAKVINGCFYYILSSLPSPSSSKTHSSTSTPFPYGLSPSGLSYGSKGKDYQGHSFWDSETWMFPPILYFYPEVAKQLLNYRLARGHGARDRATITGYKGARFPWESASTGEEVSPGEFSDGARYQLHITSDISFAIRQYVAMTRDIVWLKERQDGYEFSGCEMLRDIAQFWASRATYNESTGYHDIKDIMPPDEDHNRIDNNGFTNVGAGYSIFYAKYAECLCGGANDNGSIKVPDAWMDIAKSLKLIYDEARDYHPEYEGYQYGTTIKQADVVLMGFPLLYEMPLQTRRNDIAAYTNVSRKNGPAMTWNMHTIAFLEVDDVAEAERMFNRSYQWYLEDPFKIWLEWLPRKHPNPEFTPAANFITGMGGFLQSLFSGYGGLRVYPEKIVMRKPRVAPGSTGLVFRGVKYLGNVIDIKITETRVKFKMRERSLQFPLKISENGKEPVDFVRGALVYSTKQEEFSLEITTKTLTNCTLPLDKIGTACRPNKVEVKPDSNRDTNWWKKLKPVRRRHFIKKFKFDSIVAMESERSFDDTDNKGCSVPFAMKPVQANFKVRVN